MGFTFEPTSLDGVLRIMTEQHTDGRGFLAETYNTDRFSEHGIEAEFIHEFYSVSQQDVLRGLHFQVAPHSQAKLVTCLRGTVQDVIVDVRPSSSRFGDYTELMLDASDAVYIPPGFAHGFLVLSEQAVIHYKTDTDHVEEQYTGIRWNDSDLGITWKTDAPILSDRDQTLPTLQSLQDRERLVF